MMAERFRPRLGCRFWTCVLLMMIPIAPQLFLKIINPGHFNLSQVFLVLPIAVLITLALMAVRTRYKFEDDEIIIQNLIRKDKIPYASISEIIDTDVVTMDYGIYWFSVNRIVILYDGKHSTLSSKKKSEMLDIIKKKSNIDTITKEMVGTTPLREFLGI